MGHANPPCQFAQLHRFRPGALSDLGHRIQQGAAQIPVMVASHWFCLGGMGEVMGRKTKLDNGKFKR